MYDGDEIVELVDGDRISISFLLQLIGAAFCIDIENWKGLFQFSTSKISIKELIVLV